MTSPSAARADAIQAPSRLKLALEGCGLFDLPALAAAAPFLSMAPRGTPHAVLVLPGLGASDRSTFALRGFLASLGHDVHGWGRGRNVRLPQIEIPAIVRQVDQMFVTSGAPVSLVGWSLGGILAREAAREMPSRVRTVVTLGSPFAAPGANNVRTLWRLLTGQPATSVNAARVAELAKPLPVPATAIYTRSDGVVAWQACLEPDGPLSENIEVRTTHIGLGFHAPALWAIADRLAQRPGAWAPFRPGALLAPFFPNHR
ncbi:esterase/lipase family protein [Bradyrhizobium sp. 2TAF24]|uniref:esterase/lipase family protein n=1 Tax=Bradyrhizobium sp. 2TAF24 TaxID=3233011 RepID=UPI003F91DBED